MYKIYADDTLIYDSTLVDYKIGKGSITLETNKSGSFIFSVYPDHFYYDAFVRLKTVITVYKSGKIVFRGRILNDVTDYWNNKVITCEGELGFLQDSIIRPFSFTGTPDELFTKFIEEHNSQVDEFKRFKVGKISVVDPNDYIARSNSNYESALSNVNSRLIEDSLGGYIHITHGEDGTDPIPTINYLSDFTKVSAQKIEFGSNLKNYTKTVKADDIATAIIPIGSDVPTIYGTEKKLTIESVNDGKDYVYSKSGVALYGWITKVVSWDDVTVASILKSKAEAYLNSVIKQNVTIELNAIDLHLLDHSIESFNVGDYIHVVSAPHNFDAILLCNKQTLDLLKPENDSIVLGYAYSTFTDSSRKDLNTVKNVQQLQNDTINSVKREITNITGATHNHTNLSTLNTITDERVYGWDTHNHDERYYTKTEIDDKLDHLKLTPGRDGVSVTHSWDGTVLTLTSASGTDSVDLKGDKGDKGEKGDKGDPYTLTDTDKSDIAKAVPVPTKTSELENDSGFLTEFELTPEQLDEITDAVVESQTVNYADSVDWLNENGDTSKKYVLPDGYIYTWMYKKESFEHNANDGTGLLNTVVWGSRGDGTTVTPGVWSSAYIEIDPTVMAPTSGRLSESKVTISGLEKIVPVYNNSPIWVYYYKADGSQYAAKKGSQLASVGKDTEITLPLTLNLKDTATFADSNWANIRGVRISLGISKNSSITNDDIKNLKVSIPFFNYEKEGYGWYSTGQQHSNDKATQQNSADIANLKEEVTSLKDAVQKSPSNSGAVWYAIGDSITYGLYSTSATEYSQPVIGQRWVDYVAKYNGYELTNLGVSGSGFVSGTTFRTIVDRNDFSDVDLVTIMLGINDWKNETAVNKVGTMDDDISVGGTIVSELRYGLEKIIGDNPYCKIILITPINAKIGSRGTEATNWAYGFDGSITPCGSLKNFGDKLKEVCNYYGIQVVDMTNSSVVNRKSITTVLPDGIHPNLDCYKALGLELARRITFA